MKSLDSLLQREFEHELTDYQVHKKITNMICDMGFLIKDTEKHEKANRFHSLVKQTDRHMIVITYEIRRRFLDKIHNAAEENFEEASRASGESFTDFLRKYNLLPPNFLGPEYDERKFEMDYKEKLKDPTDHLIDHENDRIAFQIHVVNRRNMALVVDCSVRMGEIDFGKVMLVKDNANEFI